jgi:hypothetical protein
MDILSALSGITHSWEQNYSTSSHTCHITFELPESFFYVALLLKPKEILHRRTGLGSQFYFPSWSWADWTPSAYSLVGTERNTAGN